MISVPWKRRLGLISVLKVKSAQNNFQKNNYFYRQTSKTITVSHIIFINVFIDCVLVQSESIFRRLVPYEATLLVFAFFFSPCQSSSLRSHLVGGGIGPIAHKLKNKHQVIDL